MDYVENLIRQYVDLEKKLEKEQEEKLGLSRYRQSIQDMENLDLRNISEEEIIGVVKDFLYGWGNMQPGLWKFPNWKKGLFPVITKNAAVLEELRPKDLATMPLAEFKSKIENLYESFQKVVGKVGATKVLHLICCNCLPPWDNYVGAAVWEELKSRGVKLKSWSKPKSGEDYYRFVEQIQIWLIRYMKILPDLAKECRGSPLGVLDAYLWQATHRPFSLL
ncbi:MAG: hypothetical protein ACOC6R_01525 [Chloroflexota bacterium]